MPENGYIKARVSTSKGEIPVPSAVVTITRRSDGGHKLLGKRTTDLSGVTTSVTVEAPNESMSQSPSQGVPYALVNVRVDHPGYYTIFIGDAQIFARQTTIVDASLVPLAENETYDNKAEVFTETPQNL